MSFPNPVNIESGPILNEQKLGEPSVFYFATATASTYQKLVTSF
jgi:hypothetical protein